MTIDSLIEGKPNSAADAGPGAAHYTSTISREERPMQSANHQSRRAFLRHSGGLATASAVLGLSGTQSGVAEAAASTDQSRQHITTVTDSHYYSSDVRLEKGFEH